MNDPTTAGVSDSENALTKLTNSVENIANSILDVNKKIDVISDKQDKLNDKVTVLENRPATESKRRIDGIIDKMLWLIVG